MANLKIKSKGINDIYLTRGYNTEALFNINKDDVLFNETVNDFNSILSISSCSSWTNDKIKILSLPNKGRLFYKDSSNTFSNCYVGQEILVTDLLLNKVLKFNAEGMFNDQNTTSYITSFSFERYCGIVESDVICNVNLNMIHNTVSNVRIANIVYEVFGGFMTYDLIVENNDFDGFVHLVGEHETPFNTLTVENTHGGQLTVGVENIKSTQLFLPIGIYPCETIVSTIPPINNDLLHVRGIVNYSNDSQYIINNGVSAVCERKYNY